MRCMCRYRFNDGEATAFFPGTVMPEKPGNASKREPPKYGGVPLKPS